MAFFPSTPALNQEFAAGASTYSWNGSAWQLKVSAIDSPWDKGEVAPTTNLPLNGTYLAAGSSGVVASSIGATSSFATGTDPFGGTSDFLEFNALTTDWVEYSKVVVSQKSSPLYLTGDFHLEFWARPDALPNVASIAWATDPAAEMGSDGDGMPILIANSGGVTYIGAIHLGNNNTGTFAAVKNLDTTDISTGDWFHVSFVRVNNLMIIYVNGIQEELYDGSPGAPWTFPKISPATTTISNPQIVDQNFVSLGKGPGGFGVVDYNGCLAGYRLIDGKIESTALPTAYHSANALVAGDLISDGVIALSPVSFDPMETAGYAKLYNRELAFSQPDLLFLLNETSAADPVVNSGRLSATGTASNLGTPVDCPLGVTDWKKSAVFNGTSSSIMTQDAGGALSSNFRFEDNYTRGDFTIDVRFRIDSSVVGAEFVLLSTNVNGLPSASSASTVIDQYDFILLIDGANNKVRFKQKSTTEYAEFAWDPVADTDYAMSLNFHVDYNEYASTGAGSTPVTSGDGKLRIYVDGSPLPDFADATKKFVQLDEFSFVPEGNNGEIAAIQIGKYLDGTLGKWFAGQMHEYAVYNSRCNHVGDGSFIISPLPTRTTPRQVLTSIDNEGIGGTVLTTESGGVLRNHVEGLRAGTLWNDDGTVKVVGGNPSNLHDDALAFSKQAAAPSAIAGSVQIYAKDVTGPPSGDCQGLFLFDGTGGSSMPIDSSGNGNVVATRIGSSHLVESGQSPFGSGKVLKIHEGASRVGLLPETISGDFTVEGWLWSGYASSTAGVPWAIFTAPSRESTFNLADYMTLDLTNGGELNFKQVVSSTTVINITTADIRGADANSTGVRGQEAQTWSHFALVREGSDISIYFNGYRHGYATSQSVSPVNYVTGHGDAQDSWVPGMSTTNDKTYNWGGRYGVASSTPPYAAGLIDDFAIFGRAKYSGQTLTVPTAPLTPTSPGVVSTKLFVMDSAGVETQLGT